jgi:fructose-specific phosphotransferase system IIA component
MRLTEILSPDCIKVPLDASDKKNAIFELVDLLAERNHIQNTEALKEAVWQRETTRTTGIGHGLAIPHGKSECCDQLVMAIGKPTEPLDFQSIDRKPVNVIILLVSPADQTGPHIQALAHISRMMTNDKFRAAVRNADSAEQVWRLIEEHENAAASQ